MHDSPDGEVYGTSGAIPDDARRREQARSRESYNTREENLRRVSAKGSGDASGEVRTGRTEGKLEKSRGLFEPTSGKARVGHL